MCRNFRENKFTSKNLLILTKAITIVLSDFCPSADGNLELYLIARIAIQFWQQSSNKQVARTQIEFFEIEGCTDNFAGTSLLAGAKTGSTEVDIVFLLKGVIYLTSNFVTGAGGRRN